MAQEPKDRDTRQNSDGSRSVFFEGLWRRITILPELRLDQQAGRDPVETSTPDPSAWDRSVPQVTSGFISGATVGLPFVGDLLRSGGRRVGLPIADEPPSTWYGKGANLAGMTLGTIPTLYLAAGKLLGAGAGMGAKALQSPTGRTLLSMLVKPYRAAPFTAPASEALAGYAAGTFGHEAEGTAYEPMAEFAGAAAGAFVPHLFPGRLTRAITKGASRALGVTMPHARNLFSPEGREIIRQSAQSFPGQAENLLARQPLSPTSPGVQRVPEDLASASLGDLAKRQQGSIEREASQSLTGSPRGVPVLDPGPGADFGITQPFDLTPPVGRTQWSPMGDPSLQPATRGQGATVQRLDPTTITGSRAQSAVLGRVSDRADALARIDRGALSEFTNLAQLSGDPNILNNYESIVFQDPEAQRLYVTRTRKALAQLSERALRISRGESPANAPLPEVVFQLSEDLSTHARRLGRDQPRTEIATALAGDIEASYVQNRATEKALWEKAKAESVNEPLLQTEDLLNDWRAIINRVTKAEKGAVPPYILKLFPPEKAPDVDISVPLLDPESAVPSDVTRKMFSLDGENPYEIHGAISMLRETIRDNPGTRTSAIARDLANRAQKLLDTSSSIFDRPKEFTKALHGVLDRNSQVRRLFRSSGAPGSAMQITNHPTEVLEILGLGARATTSAKANTIRDLLDLSAFTGGIPPVEGGRQSNRQTVDAINNHFYQKFLEVSDNLTDSEKADQFIKMHSELWDATRFPEFVSLFDDLGKAAQVSKRHDQVGNLEKTVSEIFKSQRPLMLLQSRRRLGTALGEEENDLWKDALVDHFTRHPSGSPDAGSVMPQAGGRLLDALEDPRSRKVFDEIFDQSEIEGEEGLLRVANEWHNVDRSTLPTKGRGATIRGDAPVSTTVLQKLIGLASFGSRVVGAGVGSRFAKWVGGGAIQTPAAAATLSHNRLSNFLDKSLNETLRTGYENKPVMRDLLTPLDQLDSSALGRIFRWAKGKFGSTIALDLEKALRPFLMAATKSQSSSLSERQAAIEWFEQHPQSSVTEQFAVPPPASRGPRIGPSPRSLIGSRGQR